MIIRGHNADRDAHVSSLYGVQGNFLNFGTGCGKFLISLFNLDDILM